MAPTTFIFKEPCGQIRSTSDAMKSYLSNTIYFLNNTKPPKPNTNVTMFFATKTVYIRKYKQSITIQNTRDVNSSPQKKYAWFEIICTEPFSEL